MRPFAFIAASVAAALSLAAAGGASAQNANRRAPAAPAAAPQAAPAAAGLTPTQVRDWIISLGGEAEAIQRDGNMAWFLVKDGSLNWLLFLYNCQNDVCDDVQFAASFFTPAATPDAINNWNRDQRFLKAYTSPRSDGSGLDAVVTFDHLLAAGGVEQLADPLSVWLEQLDRFSVHIGYTAAAQSAPQ